MELKFIVTGMTCSACSARVEKVTAQINGVKKTDVNLLTGTMSVIANSDGIVGSIITAVENAGYGICIAGEEKQDRPIFDANLKDMKKRVIYSMACLIVLMYFTMGHMVGLPMPHWYHGLENALVAALLQLLLALPVVFLNRSYYSKGMKTLFHGAPNMDTLIAVGSGAALLYGGLALFRMAYAMGHDNWELVKVYSENLYFESAAMIVTLITFGKYLETKAKGKTGDAIRKLMDLSPKIATIIVDGQEQNVPIEQVKLGDVVVVRSGGRIPVDGIVVLGRAVIDQSALTGESVPVEKTIGESVAAATINTEGYIQIRAEKVGQDTTLSQIIRMVEEAGGSKAPIARLADKISGIFVPAVMTISAIVFLFWLVYGQSFEFSLTMAIAVLVISCPCALGLATPVAIMVATGRGAGMGILFKNAEVLENMHLIDTVVLDKTGTLTSGKPTVTDILPACTNGDELLILAAALEARSEHPFAKAILEKTDGKILFETQNFETLPGKGISATVNGICYYGGNRRLMQELGITVPAFQEFTQIGKTPLYFANEKKEYLGAVVVADVLKPDSADAVRNLAEIGLNVTMLTGDNHNTAKAIAEKAGVRDVISDMLPADKANAINSLKAQGRRVLMVGDGINDAPALAIADVGMAIGAGTDIAMETADVVLMNESLDGIVRAVALSKATIRNIRQNLFWAFFYNSLGIPIAAGVLYPAFGIQLSPMLGALAMSFSSVFVVSNALRLKRFQVNKHSIKEKEKKNMNTVLKVDGMMCQHCKARVEAACKAVAGTTDAIVDLKKKQVTVSGTAPVDALKKAIIDAGYEIIA